MADHIIPAPYARIHNMSKNTTPDNVLKAVRCYRNDPTTVALQIRAGNCYAHVNLTFDEVQKLIAALVQEMR